MRKGSVQTVMQVTPDSAIRLTTARYYTPSGRSIQALGIQPDIIVEQPAPKPKDEEDADTPRSASKFSNSEADLRGALNNDAVSDEEKKQIEEEARQVEATAKLREEDYQLAYAVDILKGLSAVDFRADAVPGGDLDDACASDQHFERQRLGGSAIVEEVPRRVDVRAGMSAHVDGGDVRAVATGDPFGRFESERHVARVVRQSAVERHGDINQLHDNSTSTGEC